MARGMRRGGFTLALASLALGSCAPRRPPAVVLISIDTLRADHLGCYGYGRATTPRLDALAAEGTRFASAFAPSSWTLPSHVSLVTGLHPPTHGVRQETIAIPPSAPLLGELFRQGGFRTAGFVSHIYLDERYGFARGFERYERSEGRAGEVVDRALAWLQGVRGDDRFFLFVHLFDPHWDYDPPPPFDTRFLPGARREMGKMERLKPYITAKTGVRDGLSPAELAEVVALYDGEIAYTDEQVGRLLDGLRRLGRYDRTLVAVTSDHGEEFQDHGSIEGHQWTLYDEVLHVPLIVKPPGAAVKGRVAGDQVQLTDLAPTLLAAMGLAVPPAMEGKNLLPLLAGDGRAPERPAYADLLRFRRSGLAVRRDGFKLIRMHEKQAGSEEVTARTELYDVGADPREQSDLAPSDPARTRALEQDLVRWLRTSRARALRGGADVVLDEETREKLRSLGYAQ